MQTGVGKQNLVGLPEPGLRSFFAEIGEKPFRARQIMRWIHQRGVADFETMTDLSRDLRSRLDEIADVTPPVPLSTHRSGDGTVKWLFRAGGGQAIETVFIPEADRGTLCISSQVGCVLDCAFCATGAQGFNRNLGVDEIIGQVWHANRELPPRQNGERAVTNVVFMGMGEPLANYRNLLPALDLLLSDYAYGLSRRRITVSTAGLVPNIERLGDDCNVSLAVSLHASNDALRDDIVPINRIHPIGELLDACWRYADKHSKRFITFEYVMLNGVNDSLGHANELAGLLRSRPAKVNLIPFNAFPGTRYQCSPAGTIAAFQRRLRDRGIVTTTRKTRGDDIAAACGQLAGKVTDRIRTRLGDRRSGAVTA
ncbi:MAG: 23S rRNA (adenine(2503)-C(2))-methyltransferase RlmN [Woeseiaceae bacterium]|nr:23S rRNA (adenine(2503)-C(2))-methyltransferase RlmN [Woeseiaceae bacterium]